MDEISEIEARIKKLPTNIQQEAWKFLRKAIRHSENDFNKSVIDMISLLKIFHANGV